MKQAGNCFVPVETTEVYGETIGKAVTGSS